MALPLAIAIAIASGTTPDKALLTASIAGFLISALGGSRVQIGGLPATGAIARTATNVRAGAVSPVAGMLHAIVLLTFLLVAAPLVREVPLASLAALLAVVAYNMSEHERFRHLLSAPRGDWLVLLVTFGLTVFTNLTLAIEVGVVLAALLFMDRMARVVEIGSGAGLMDEAADDLESDPDRDQRLRLSPGVEAYQINGPLFFGVASRLDDVLDQFAKAPCVFILRTRLVPMIDASGVHALQGLAERCERRAIHLILSGLQAQPQKVLDGMKFRPVPGRISFAEDFSAALVLARQLTSDP